MKLQEDIFNNKLKDFCLVGDGTHASIKRQGAGVLYLTSKNFKSNGLDLSKVDYISETDYEKHFEKSRSALVKPNAEDVVFGIIGSIGTPYIVKPNDRFGISSSVAILRPRKDVDSRYLYHYMTSSPFQSAVEAIKSGVAQGFLSLEMIRNLPLIKHELSTQRKIAAILTAYDDLIEINKRRIALLEKMAEELYREWFVRMRFPCHQNTRFVKGLPAEWDIRRIRDIVDRKRFGKIYRPADLAGKGSIIVIDQSRSDYLGFYEGKPEHEASPEYPTLLFGDHSCKMVFMTRPFSLAENVIPFIPKADMPAYFLFHLIKDLAKTTEYKRHWTELVNREVLIPLNELQVKFSGIVRENHLMREKLIEVNRNLIKTRDLLLPRLISGKLSVEDLDIQFPPSMQEGASH